MRTFSILFITSAIIASSVMIASSVSAESDICRPDPIFISSAPVFTPPGVTVTARTGHTQEEAQARFTLIRDGCASGAKRQMYNQDRGYLDCVATDGFIRGYEIRLNTRNCRYLSTSDPDYIFQ